MNLKTQKKKSRPDKITPVAAPVELKLDFGAGRNPQPGFKSVDFYAPDADYKVNLFEFPLPWKDGEVSEIFASHFIEHIPAKLRWPFFEECWRILKPDGIMRIFVPNWKSERAYGDMTHEWPPVTTMALLYLNKGWMTANKLTYGAYDLKCNFDYQAGPTAMSQEFQSKAHEVQVFACAHYLESFSDMWVTLTKRPL